MKVPIPLSGFPLLSLSASASIKYLQAIPASLTLVLHLVSSLVGSQALFKALASRDDSEEKNFRHDQGALIQFAKLANSASNPITSADVAICGLFVGDDPRLAVFEELKETDNPSWSKIETQDAGTPCS